MQRQAGFTLVELSMVIIIIGLIAGGIMVGRDLIAAALVRAQISQLEKYRTAVNTFEGKYNALPGDINEDHANEAGLAVRGADRGEGDENGILEAPDGFGGWCGTCEGVGETAMFWVDLSAAGLIEGSFTKASAINMAPNNMTAASSPGFNDYFPQAKIGNGNYMYVYSAGGINYYGLSSITGINSLTGESFMKSVPLVSVQQAYAIDQKTDDGYPQSGNVTAQYATYIEDMQSLGFTMVDDMTQSTAIPWAGATGTAATAGSANTCYDNKTVGGAQQQYSMEINGGTGRNCALSFKF